MKRYLVLASWFALFASIGTACSAGDPQQFSDEGVGAESVGSETEAVSKCNGGKIGASNYCTPTCKCNDGEGDCDSAADCINGSCSGTGLYFYGVASNACAPAHCANGVKDADETQKDCGGSCGSNCPNVCTTLPANCQIGHCTAQCPCADTKGDCANNGANCASGFCKADVGASYGCGATIDICLAAHCNNGVTDGGETGVDCGGVCTACVAGDVQSKTFGGTLRDHGIAVVYDNQGNYIVAGRYNGTANFGGSNLTSAGSSDLYVAKYNSLGVHQWSKTFGGTGPDVDLDIDIGVDASRSIIIAGNFWNSVNFGGGVLTSAGSADIFVLKLTETGAFTWAKRFGGTGADRVNAISVLSAGSIQLGGAFQNTVNIANTNLTAVGNYDALLFKVASNGTAQWAKAWGSADSDQVNAIGVDTASNIYVGGAFGGTITFGANTFTANTASLDAFNMKTDAAGNVLWSKAFGGTSSDTTLAIAVTQDATRAPLFVGRYRGTANLGGGNVTSAGVSDVFAVAYDTNGTYKWSKNWGGTGEDRALGATTDPTNNYIVVGDFSGTVDFGTGSKTAATGLTSAFVIRYSPAGAVLLGTAYGNPGGASAGAVAAKTGRLVFTGDMTGTVNFGSGNLTSLGQTDMFWAKL
jgi:hypothetical protein